MGSGCDTVDSAVASDTRGRGFGIQSSATFIEHLFAINVSSRDENIEKIPRKAHSIF